MAGVPPKEGSGDLRGTSPSRPAESLWMSGDALPWLWGTTGICIFSGLRSCRAVATWPPVTWERGIVAEQTALRKATLSQVTAVFTHRHGFMPFFVKWKSSSVYICLEYKRLKCLQSSWSQVASCQVYHGSTKQGGSAWFSVPNFSVSSRKQNAFQKPLFI